MIHPFSIALVYGGKRSGTYAKIMKELIKKECEVLPVIPLLCDTTENIRIMDAVEKVFAPSDYAIVFFTKAYCGHKSETEGNDLTEYGMTTPNLMLEFGYLIKHIGLPNIRIITDFDYNTLQRTYAFPSDIIGEFVDCHPDLANAPDEKIEEILSGVIKRDLNDIQMKYRLSSKKDLDSSSSPHFHDMFYWEMERLKINNYELTKQIEILFKTWCSEVSEFNAMQSETKSSYLIMYLYERVPFLMLFTGIDSLQLSRLMLTKDSTSNIAEITAYNDIIKYINAGTREKSSAYFFNHISKLSNCLHGLSSSNVFIQLIVYHFLGLSYLNHYLCDKSDPSDLDFAEKYFYKVIERSQERFDPADSELLMSYAYYNLARVQFEKHSPISDWCASFDYAIEYRRALSLSLDFPYCIQLYYKNELYHAMNAKTYHICKSQVDAFPSDDIVNDLLLNEKNILESLSMLEQTIVAGQPLFKSVKENAQKNISRLQGKSTMTRK